MPELRKDPVVGRWVIISTERARRPSDFAVAPAVPSNSAACVFCPGREVYTPDEVWAARPHGSSPNGPGWRLRVVPNKFPALRIEGELEPSGEGLYDRMSGVGAHEVIIETPDHHASLATLPPAHVADILAAYRDRMLDLRKDQRLEYVMVFKNHGEAAGASLEHPHSQLIATPIVPIMVEEELVGGLQHYRIKKRCIWCDIVRQERAGGGASSSRMPASPCWPRSPRGSRSRPGSCPSCTGRATRRSAPKSWKGSPGCWGRSWLGWAGSSATLRTTSCCIALRSAPRLSTTSTGTSRSSPS